MSIAKERQTPLTNNSSVVKSRLRIYDSSDQATFWRHGSPFYTKTAADFVNRPQMAGQMGHFRLHFVFICIVINTVIVI